jgi:hypothetical protein
MYDAGNNPAAPRLLAVSSEDSYMSPGACPMRWGVLIPFLLLALVPTQALADCIRCSCSEKNYAMDEIGLCQSECKVSLGCFSGICGPANLPGADPTALQWSRQTDAFPNLHCFNVLSQEDQRYNCIAWSVGNDRQWIWKEVDLIFGDMDGTVEISDFDDFYQQHGFAPAADCSFKAGKHKVALFGKGTQPTHAARQSSDTPGWWESKEGKEKKSLHKLTELEGGVYGDVIKCYERSQP